MLVSICIPSYNRPHTLIRLLESIDLDNSNDFEIVICEDKSPKRNEIREVVEKFKAITSYEIKYFENIENYGYDRNISELIKLASGDFIIYMGDDDYFVKNSLSQYFTFLRDNQHLGYVLKTWINLHENGDEELFNYFHKRKFFEPSPDSFVKLFRLSTFISGFTFKRELAIPFLKDDFNGTLLFQLYILGELALRYPSAFCEIPLTIQTQLKVDVPHFGSSISEKGLYTPGEITIQNSIVFLNGYFKITKYLDNEFSINTTEMVKKDMTKFSYSYLFLHRDKGIKKFYKYYRLLKNDIGLNKSIHIDIYFLALLILGKVNCNRSIFLIKKLLKGTPSYSN